MRLDRQLVQWSRALAGLTENSGSAEHKLPFHRTRVQSPALTQELRTSSNSSSRASAGFQRQLLHAHGTHKLVQTRIQPHTHTYIYIITKQIFKNRVTVSRDCVLQQKVMCLPWSLSPCCFLQSLASVLQTDISGFSPHSDLESILTQPSGCLRTCLSIIYLMRTDAVLPCQSSKLILGDLVEASATSSTQMCEPATLGHPES